MYGGIEMFDMNNHEMIAKIIEKCKPEEYVIPLYVRIYDKYYSITEINEIDDFNPSAFKVGFGSACSIFHKNSFPAQCTYSFENTSIFTEFDEERNVYVRYLVFESNGGFNYNEEHHPIYDQINEYCDMLFNYIKDRVIKIKKERIRKQIEEEQE